LIPGLTRRDEASSGRFKPEAVKNQSEPRWCVALGFHVASRANPAKVCRPRVLSRSLAERKSLVGYSLRSDAETFNSSTIGT